MNGEVILHLHGVFARKDYSTLGGHVKKLIISATGEVALQVYDKQLFRSYDPKTGLNLISKSEEDKKRADESNA